MIERLAFVVIFYALASTFLVGVETWRINRNKTKRG